MFVARTLQILRKGCRPGALAVALVLGGEEVASAQSRGARQPEQVRLRIEAERLLEQDQLTEAEFQLQRSLALDTSAQNEAAHALLIDVYLAGGHLTLAQTALDELSQLSRLSAEGQRWVARAQERLRVERLLGLGDAQGARAALDPLRAQLVTPPEQQWLRRAEARVGLREYEARRQFAEGRSALERARLAPDLSPSERLWLEGATLRLEGLALEHSCAWSGAAAQGAVLAAREDLPPADRTFGEHIQARAAAWIAAESGDTATAQAVLARFGSPTTGDPAWVEGFSTRLRYLEELSLPARQRDADTLDSLWPIVRDWQQSQPACTWLEAPNKAAEAPARAWVQTGLSGGVVGYTHDLSGTAAPGVQVPCAEPCWAPSAGLRLAGGVALRPQVALWGRLDLAQPAASFGAAPMPWPQAQGQLTLALVRGPVQVGAGGRLHSGVWAWEESGLDRVMTLVDLMGDLSVRVRPAPLPVDLTVSAAGAPRAVYAGLDLGWRPRAAPLRVGLEGSALRGSRPEAERGDVLVLQRTDVRAGLNVSWQWEVR